MEVESRGEPHGPEHAEPVLLEPALRIPDRPDEPELQIPHAAHMVDRVLGPGDLQEPVDREVPALYVLPLVDGVCHGVRPPAVAVSVVPPKRGHFGDVVAVGHSDHAVAATELPRAREDRDHLVGKGACRDVAILHLQAQLLVADAAANPVGLVTATDQFADDAPRHTLIVGLSGAG